MKKLLTLILAVLSFSSVSLMAQEWSTSATVSFAANYLWRGTYLMGTGIVPELELDFDTDDYGFYVGTTGYKGINETAFAAVEWPNTYHEIDFYAGAYYDKFTLELDMYNTDFDCLPNDKFETPLMALDVTLNYDFDFGTSLYWGTIVACNDASCLWSSYAEVKQTFSVNDNLQFEAMAGALPFTSYYMSDYEGFQVVNLLLQGTYNLEFDKFTMPIQLAGGYNPSEKMPLASLMIGFSF